MSRPDESDHSLTHFDEQGNARMVDIGSKNTTARTAVAVGTVILAHEAYNLVKKGNVAKGDVLGVARVAGIMAAKKVDELIPLTHTLPVNSVSIDFQLEDSKNSIGIEAKVSVTGKTGVEMEALTAVSVAALTIYDMCKAVDKSIVIQNIHLDYKEGGKSGTYIRNN